MNRHSISLASASLALGLMAPALAQAQYRIESISFPPATPDAVTLCISAPSQALILRSTLKLNGKNVTSLFVPVPGTGAMTATVPGLVPGTNTIQLTSGKTSSVPLAQAQVRVITAADCNAARLGTSIDTSSIGEPVTGVNLTSHAWTNASASNQAFCRVNGNMTPVDPTAQNINFGVTLPARWAMRYAQMGGGGMNGSVPGLAGADYNNRGMATVGSDSGHSFADGNNWA